MIRIAVARLCVRLLGQDIRRVVPAACECYLGYVQYFHISCAMGKCCLMPFLIRYQIYLLQMAAYNITHTKSNAMVNASQFMRVARWKFDWLT